MASMVPPVNTVSLSGSVPAASHMGTTTGICDADDPDLTEQLGVPLAARVQPGQDVVTAVSMAGTPDRA